MKTTELRIGNLVHVPSTNQDAHIATISGYFGVELNNSLSYLGFKEIKPIPLTEEWLIKLGVKRNPHSKSEYYLSVTNLKAEFHFETFQGEIVTTIKSQFSDLILDPIVSVHQLQNLYFALTGEELKIQEP